MEYSIIDSQMVNPKKRQLIKLAHSYGFKYYSELLHKFHCIEKRSPREISEMLFDEKGETLASKEGIYYTLNKYGWLVKKTEYRKPANIHNSDVAMCICCGRAPIHKTLHRLCMVCYKSDGHHKKGAQGGNFDPHGEYSSGATMVPWGQG